MKQKFSESQLNQFLEVAVPVLTTEMRERLKIVRMKRMMNQKAFAEALGVNAHVISSLENDENATKLFTIATLVKFLGFPDSSYVFFNHFEKNYDFNVIRERYWSRTHPNTHRKEARMGVERNAYRLRLEKAQLLKEIRLIKEEIRIAKETAKDGHEDGKTD